MTRRSLGLMLWLGVGCDAETRHGDATQVVVRIDASSEVREAAKLLRIRAAVQDTRDAKWSERKPLELQVGELKAGQKEFWPVDIPVSPRNPDAPPWLFELVIEAASSADGEPVVQTRVLSGFVKESERMLLVTLQACDSGCEPDANCHGAHCHSCQLGKCDDETKIVAANTLQALQPISTGVAGHAAEGGGGSSGETGGHSAGSGMLGAGDGGSSGMPAEAGSGGTKPDTGQHAPAPAKDVWSSPELVSIGSSAVTEAVAASNQTGDTVVAYRQQESGGFVWLRRFLTGAVAWEKQPTPLKGLVPSVAPNVMPNQRLAVGIDSSASVQLLYRDGQPKTLWVNWDGTEASLSEAQPPLVLGTQTLANFAALSVTDSGLATAAWLSLPSFSEPGVYINFRARDVWGKPLKLDDIGQAPRAAGFAANGTGAFVFVVADSRMQSNGAEGPTTLKSFVGDVDNPMRKREELSAQTATDLDALSCALDTTGNATLLYLAVDQREAPEAFWHRYDAKTETWTAQAKLSERLIAKAKVVASGADGAVALLQVRNNDKDAEHGQIVAQRYRDGAWAKAEPISAELVMAGTDLELSATPAGGLIAAWTEPGKADGQGMQQLLYRRLDEKNVWSEPAPIGTVPSDTDIVHLTVDQADHALIVWREPSKDGVTLLKASRSTSLRQ